MKSNLYLCKFVHSTENGKDLNATIDGETKNDVQRLLLGLLLVNIFLLLRVLTVYKTMLLLTWWLFS